jgi:TolB protein
VKRLSGIVFLFFCAVSAAQARLSIEITEGVEGALPIGVIPFGWAGPGRAPEDIAAIISSDLSRSGRFAPTPFTELPERPHDAGEANYATWRAAKVDNLVVGTIAPRDGGGYIVRFQLLDVLKGQQLAGFRIPSTANRLRRTAHQISDIVYEKLTGEPGAFDTHIAYVTADQRGKERHYQLAVADADGFNEQVILKSKQPIMSPAWAPDGMRLAYVSFEQGRSIVYVQEVANGKRRKVAGYEGINSAPAWSPNGRYLALTLSKDGNAEVYVLELATGKLSRITQHYAIDTEPAWMPDGSALVFTSDRGGRPQLYRVALSRMRPAGRPERLTFEGEYNARAAISPDGGRIAMVHGNQGQYRIAVMDLETGNLRVLTRTRLDESPSFAPNGSMLIYATEMNGRGILEAVSADGRAHQRLGLMRADVREPAWSPAFSN